MPTHDTLPKDRPILFSAPMVQAILAGRKTQTRRVLKMPIGAEELDDLTLERIQDGYPDGDRPVFGTYEEPNLFSVRCPYGQPGDRLWVRESFRLPAGFGKTKPSEVVHDTDDGRVPVWYEADGAPSLRWPMCVRPSIHMPRWASRLTLEVTTVRVERLSDLTEEDAKSEGVRPHLDGYYPYGIRTCLTIMKDGEEVPAQFCPTARDSFIRLWDSINASRGLGWDSNPWVWVVEFERIVT